MMYNICVNKNATSPGINNKEFFDSNNRKTSPANEKKKGGQNNIFTCTINYAYKNK